MNQIEGYQPLFDLMKEEHGLILLESEMDEIIRTYEIFMDKINEQPNKEA